VEIFPLLDDLRASGCRWVSEVMKAAGAERGNIIDAIRENEGNGVSVLSVD
jgi:hypothetical protein